MHNAQYISLQGAKEIWKNEQVVFEKLMFDPLLWLTCFLIRHSIDFTFYLLTLQNSILTVSK